MPTGYSPDQVPEPEIGEEPIFRAATCLNCQHWAGDKTRARLLVAEFGAEALSEKRGIAPEGLCAEAHRLDLEVSCGQYCQGGSAVFSTPAWFGCVMHEEEGASF